MSNEARPLRTSFLVADVTDVFEPGSVEAVYDETAAATPKRTGHGDRQNRKAAVKKGPGSRDRLNKRDAD